MKSFKLAAISTCLAVVMAPAVWAADAPAACPTVDKIVKGSLSGVSEDKEDSLYFAYQISKYNTPATWAFVIGVPFEEATSKGDAMNKAKAALKTLKGTPEPIPTDNTNKRWYCMYENDYNYLAVSITPLDVSNELARSAFQFNQSYKLKAAK